jgi:hypothetical protein
MQSESLLLQLKEGTTSEIEHDIEKLEKFTDQGEAFKYKLGLFLKIIGTEVKEILWFKNGKQLN